jgi:Cdc6-like AAA superfamily ATPase
VSTISEKDLKEKIKNTIIVMDEIHNIRKDSGDKKTYYTMKRLYESSSGCKFIIASATSMVNKITQMDDILELI